MAGIPRGVEIVDDAFSHGAEIIDVLESRNDWARSTVGADGHEGRERTSDTCFAPFISYTNPAPIEGLGRVLWQVISNYAALYGIRIEKVEPITFNRYAPGQFFGAHSDYFADSNRVFSAVAYLNTVPEGGVTRFIHFDHEVQAVAGRIVVFPSNYLFAHEGTAPVGVTKYSAAFWVRG